MARRRGKALSFLDGFNAGYDTVGKVAEGFQLADVNGMQSSQVGEASGEDAYQAAQSAMLKAQADNPQEADRIAADYAPTFAALEARRSAPEGAHYSMGEGNSFTQFDHAPTATEQGAVRNNARADIIAARDPLKAEQLRHTAALTLGLERKNQDDAAIRSAFSQDTAPVRGLQRTQASAGATEGQATTPDIQPTSRVGSNLTTDPAFAKSMADNEAFATGAAVEPTPAYRVPGRGTYDNAADAIDSQQQARSDSGLAGLGSEARAAEAALMQAGARSYHERKAPQVVEAYLKQGKVAEAKAYRDFIDSEDGRAYAGQWSQGVRKLMLGDYKGALGNWQSLYNKQLYNDGHTVKLTPLEDGKQVRSDFFDQAGNQVHSTTMPMDALARQAGMALSPEKLVEMRAKQDSQREHDGSLLDRQLQLEGLRQKGQEIRDDRRDERVGMRIDAQSEALDRRLAADAERRGGLTATQQRTNDSIAAARKQLAGMSADDVRKKTQQYEQSGRINDEFDAGLARAAKLATSRMFGEDPEHDRFSGAKGKENAAANAKAETATRFGADPAMKSYRLGAQTPQGHEVRDAAGKLLGYYR
jgi:hypothetical protein